MVTVISIFAGCGGSSLGYKMVGYKELLAIEWDNNAVETFKLNFPEVPIWKRDIREIKGKEILDFLNIKKGELDLLDGSPPCQGFSTAGKRKVNDDRNNLVKENIRLIEELEPKVFVIENVSGMIKGKMKGLFIEYINKMKSLDYQVKCKLMNAKYYNVPQSRQRVIFIGTRKDLEIEPSYPKPNNKLITTREALEGIKDMGKELTPEAKKYYPKLKYGESASKYHPKGHLFGLIKLDPDKPCPTLTRSAGAAKHVHWKEERFIGIKERARIGTFPDSFKWIGNWTDIYDMIGNSVLPLFMRAIAEYIRINILEKAVKLK